MDLLHLLANVELPTTAMLKTIDDYRAGRLAGLAGEPAQPDQSENWRQAWTSGDVKRRVNAGLALAVMTAGTHCKTCESINYGYRMGCRCNGDIEWGALMMNKDGAPAAFSRWEDLRTARAGGMPVLDADTGLDFCLEEEAV